MMPNFWEYLSVVDDIPFVVFCENSRFRFFSSDFVVRSSTERVGDGVLSALTVENLEVVLC